MAARQVRAQTPRAFQPEARIDLFFATGTTVQAAAGGAWALDPNVRVVLLGGLGSTYTSGAGQFSARADLLARYVLDPERTQTWALYGTGGISVRYEAQPSWRGAFVALLGLEGPRWGKWTPFLEAGYGGGVEVGFGLRRARVTGR
jgi:hypothetical protein